MSKRSMPRATAADMASPPSPKRTKGISGLVQQLALPLRDEVAAYEDPKSPDRPLRRALDEVLYDCKHGLTNHSAARAARDLDGAVSAWFARRDEAQAARNAEMSRVIASMGSALKSLHGDDSDFYEHLESNLSRLKGAVDSTSARSASMRLARLVQDMSHGIAAQKEASEKRVRQLAGMVQGLNSELQTARMQLAEDALTGLYNRGAFDQHLAQALAKARLAPYRFTLVLVDLDNFKAVNDTHGHVAGDRVLKQTAQILQRFVLRASDLAFRYGGEEMAIVLDDSGAGRGARIAEEIRAEMVNTVFELPDAVHAQTASFGVAEGSDRDTSESLIQRADECLYLAKKNGRNRVVAAGWGEIGKRVAVPRGVPAESDTRGRR